MRSPFFAIVVVLALMFSLPVFGFMMSMAVPWIAFGLIAWGGMMLLRGPRRPRRPYYVEDWRAYRVPPAPRPARPARATAPAAPINELPFSAQVKVNQIRRKAEALQQQSERFPLASPDLHVVRQTLADYLPRTIEAYLRMPPADRERVLRASGKTALRELEEQLTMLEAKLDEIVANLRRANVDRLLANRRFLEERLAKDDPSPAAVGEVR